MSNFSVAVPSTVYQYTFNAFNGSSGKVSVANGTVAGLANLSHSSSRILGVSGGNPANTYKFIILGTFVQGNTSPSVELFSSSTADTSVITVYWVNEVASSPNFGGNVGTNTYGVATAPVSIQPC